MKTWATYLNQYSHLVTTICLLFFIRTLVTALLSLVRRHRLAVDNDCRTGKTYQHLDPYSGIGLLRRAIRDYKTKNVLETWRGFSNNVGTTFSFWVLGNRNLVTSEPENVKTIFSDSFQVFDHGPRRRYGYRPLLGDGIFAVDGAKWSEARALFRPSFNKSQICDVDMFEQHFQRFLKALPANGVPIDLQELFKRLSMDIITDLLFGKATETLSENDQDGLMTFSHACEYSQKVVWRNLALGWIGTLLPDREDSKSRKLLQHTVDQYVQQALHGETEQIAVTKKKSRDRKAYVFLDNLAQRTRNPQILRDQILSALLGGRDTTSSLLSNLLHTLARRPQLWSELREEAISFAGERLTQDCLKQALLVRQCLQESLRLHPVVPINQRWANTDTVLPRGGDADESAPLLVPRGSNVFINVYAMHRRQDIWGSDAEEFQPQRWADPQRQPPSWAYVPFGGGPRICVGQEFALTEATYILIRMLQCFEKVESTDQEPWRENLSITLTNASGCNVILH